MATKNTINQGVARDEREARAMTKEQMADVLGIEGPNAEQIVTDFEAGFRQAKGPTLRIYESLNRGRYAGETLLNLPRWSVDADASGHVIHYNGWPRFVGRAFREELHPEQWRFKKAGMAAYALDPKTGYRQLVLAFIDHVPDGSDPEDVVAEGVRHLERVILKGDGHGH